jgi:hypothetical protein
LFVTSEHVGGYVGQKFYFKGINYTAQAYYDDPNSDLRIWKVDRNFPYYAPLYRGTAEVGKQAWFFGRGTQRGSDVYQNGQRKGWRWGAVDGVMSWGTNTVSKTFNGGTGVGNVLMMDFNATGGRNEGTLSGYDSGGGAFVNDGGVWKLLGVNYAAKGPYSLTGQTGGFNASLFDEGGMWVGQDGRRWFVGESSIDAPGASYVTRVSSDLGWIDSVVRANGGGTLVKATNVPVGVTAVPEPGSIAVIALGSGVFLLMRRQKRSS